MESKLRHLVDHGHGDDRFGFGQGRVPIFRDAVRIGEHGKDRARDAALHLGLGRQRQDDGAAGVAGLGKGRDDPHGKGHHGQQDAHDTGHARHDNQGRPKAGSQSFEVHADNGEGLFHGSAS